jgi:hypothetical protein
MFPEITILLNTELHDLYVKFLGTRLESLCISVGLIVQVYSTCIRQKALFFSLLLFYLSLFLVSPLNANTLNTVSFRHIDASITVFTGKCRQCNSNIVMHYSVMNCRHV